MKNLLIIHTTLVLFCLTNICYSQAQENLFESKIWLKPKDTLSGTSLGTSEISPLNFILPIRFAEDEISQKYLSVITKQSSFFTVFKTDEDNEEELLKLQVGVFKTILKSKVLIHDKEEQLNKFDPVLGNIVSHIFSRNSLISRKKGALTFNDQLYNDPKAKNKLYELVYIPRIVNNKEQAIIETYLSIKYGISQLPDKNYLNFKGDTIWNFKTNRNFNFRVTGIGKDTGTTLNQKQSGNNTKDGLYIGLDKITKLNLSNKGSLPDDTYFIWGDNGLKANLEENTPEGYVKMGRIWKAEKRAPQTYKINTQLLINKKQMLLGRKPGDKEFLWLVQDTVSTDNINYSKAIYTQATTENDSLVVFDNVQWSAKSTLFSFVVGPPLLVNYDLTASSCLTQSATGKIDLKIAGGISPYSIKIYASGFYKELESIDGNVLIEGVHSGQFTLEVSDQNKNIYKKDIVIDPFSNSGVSLSPTYILEKGEELIIVPVIKNDEVFNYSWSSDDKILSITRDFRVSTPGIYNLTVSNTEGCEKTLPFTVVEKDNETNAASNPESQSTIADGYKIYPNPCEREKPFTIEFNLSKDSKVNIQVSDLNGKIIIEENLGQISMYKYNTSLLTEATYVVVVTIDGVPSSSKLIIL